MLSIFIRLMVFTAALSSNMSEAKNITYMGLGGDRDAYHTELLTEIFKYSPTQNYQINRYSEDLPHHRSFIFLDENKGIDIVIAYATEERDQKYLAVPIPILKGLNGWRLSVVHKDNIDILKNVANLADLKKFKVGQFHAWTDSKILMANGLQPVKGSDFIGLYHMLNKKRFDYLPRSILEIDHEVKSLSQTERIDVVIEPNILIYYPTAFYFYVKKSNTELARDLTKGLEAIIRNGKFDEIFYRHFGEIITKIRKEKRNIIVLKNPLLPKSAPLERKELWLNLFEPH